VLSRGCYAALSHEGACREQVERLTGGRHAPIITFVPIFQLATFASVAERTPPRPPFRLLFAGRVEPEKGVFDLLSVARLLAAEGRYDIEFEVCGQGSALSALRGAVAAQGLEARFKIRGFKNRLQLREMFARCHAVIVPSRAQEGFSTVVAEATLAGRPVIATSLCPAVDLVGETAIRVGPSDISAMHDAIVRLSEDDAEYEARRRASAAHRAQFLDGACGWGAALRTALAPLAGLVSSRACSSPGAWPR
jgi:glycosyltransferase involved in cell wall biosynthesis